MSRVKKFHSKELQSTMSFKPRATFTFFSLSNCGYCKQYKGEKKNSKGQIEIDPKSGWETLRNDQDLYDAGVEFVLYLVGDVQDPKTGKVTRYTLEPEYKGKIKGYPHLDLSVPSDRFNGIKFDGRITGWEADKSFPVIKKWILEKLKTEPFKSYNPSVKAPAPKVTPQSAPRPEATPSPAKQLAQQSQQSLLKIPRETPKISAQERRKNTPSVAGMGSRPTPPAIQQEPERVQKAPPRFLPANYDE